MKKLSIAFLVLLVLTGCQTQTKDEEKLNVVTSFYPIYDFASKVGGEHVSVHNVLPNGQDPHSFEPTTKDMAAIESADIFIYHGAGLESWVGPVLKRLEKSETRVIEISSAVSLLEAKEHDHDHEGHEDHDHGDFDPHTWLSPVNALKQTSMIRHAFIELDPDHKDDYNNNFAKYETLFEELDSQYRDLAKNVESKTFMVDHEAYGYLAHEYGLIQRGVFENILSEEPTPKELEQMIETIKSENIKAIYVNPHGTQKVVDVIAKETGVEVYPLYTLESMTSQSDDVDYFSLMKENLESLKEGLGYRGNR